VFQPDLTRLRVDAGDARIQAQVDVALLVPRGASQRNPVLLSFARQIVFRQVGPVDWHAAGRADDDNAARIAKPPQLFRCSVARRAAADDHDLTPRLGGPA